MSQWSATYRDSRTPTPTSSLRSDDPRTKAESSIDSRKYPTAPPEIHGTSGESASTTPASSSSLPLRADDPLPLTDSPSASPAGRKRSSSRPLSMVQTYQPPLMDVSRDTLPELQPIFTLLNSHANKLYQEGYFLKLDDQDSKGNPNQDRTWTECFAQLVGTVLSLWDAAELDAAGPDAEVLPKFINLTDASIKMIESLPTRSSEEQPLQNILNISTAGRNRYLLHFNSHHSLIQWTAGIRLAMYEQATLQEAYTGALIAGKGKHLNNINLIMERARLPVQQFVRVRFGAGVPWRRCWCVIEPPSDKDYQKAQKELKKKSAYERHGPVLKGEIRFYDTRREAEKKRKYSKPIATITDAYSAYAIYPQAKALIDGSSLLKLEGNITIHSSPPSSTEGFIFIMPEVHPAVSGFEMLLRYLFPTWDTFALYGRPGRLVASSLDSRSLMFAMPKHKKYGYLELLDVSGLILTDGSMAWSEHEWRKKLKELTGKRMNALDDGTSDSAGRSSSRSSPRLSFGQQNMVPTRPRVNFAENSPSVRTSRSMSLTSPAPRTDSAPAEANRSRSPLSPPSADVRRHSRNISDTQLANATSSKAQESQADTLALRPPERSRAFESALSPTPERVSSEDEEWSRPSYEAGRRLETPEPVNTPPAFAHAAGSRPQQNPYHSPELRRATSRLSSTTLSQLAKAGGLSAEALREGSDALHRGLGDDLAGSVVSAGKANPRAQPVQPRAITADPVATNANHDGVHEAVMPSQADPILPSPNGPMHIGLASERSMSPVVGPWTGSPTPGNIPLAMDRSGLLSSLPASTPTISPISPILPIMSPRGTGNGHGHAVGPPMLQTHDLCTRPPGPSAGHRSYSPSATPGTLGPNNSNGPLPPRQAGLLPPRSPASDVTPHFSRKPLSQGVNNTAEQFGCAPMSPPTSPLVANQAGDGFSSIGYLPTRQDSQVSDSSSHYHDTASTYSAEYARICKFIEDPDRAERPCVGILTTDNETAGGNGAPSKATSSFEFDSPGINFGSSPNHAAGAGPAEKVNERGQTARNGTEIESEQTPPPSSPASSHIRQQSEDRGSRRSVIWQPGIAIGSPPRQLALTPDEFVHQRAVAANPQYGHLRKSSSQNLPTIGKGGSSPTPMGMRPEGLCSRHESPDLLQSAGRSGGEVSSHLSAREQEHVARVTGGPLVALAGYGKNGGQVSQGGLVGAIEAREREKAQIKQSMNNHALAYAIDQRQREQNQQAQKAAAHTAYARSQQVYMGQVNVGQPLSMPSDMGGPRTPIHGGHFRSMSPAPGIPASMAAGMGPPRSMSPGPNTRPCTAPGMPTSMDAGPGPGPAPMLPARQRPPIVPPSGHYNSGHLPNFWSPPPISPMLPFFESSGFAHSGMQPALPKSPRIGNGNVFSSRPGLATTAISPPVINGQPPVHFSAGTPSGLRPGTPGRSPFPGSAR